MHRAIIVALSLWFSVEAHMLHAAEPVGPHGNLDTLVLHGTKTFPVEQLKAALAWHPTVQHALTPSAPLDNLLRSIEKTLKAGYQHAGFAHPVIKARKSSSPKGILVEVSEGVPVLAGRVEVQGNQKLNTEQLIQHITRPYQPKPVPGQSPDATDLKVQPPSWAIGQAAPLDSATQAKIRRKLEQACRDQGFFFTQLETSTTVDLRSQTAQLHVLILEEGPAGTIHEITVQGLEKNSRKDLLQFLGIQAGTSLDRDTVEQVRHQLWKSARFSRLSVRPRVNQDQLQLAIHAIEFKDAPHLLDSLPKASQSMLKIQQWLSGFTQTNHDLVFTYEPGLDNPGPKLPFKKIRCILSPGHGILAEIQGDLDKVYTGHHTLLLQDNQLECCNWNTGQQFLARDWKIKPQFSLAMVPSYDDTSGETSSDLQVSVGISSRDKQDATGSLETRFHFAPVVFLREAMKASNRITTSDEAIVLDNDSLCLVANADTGAIQKIQFKNMPGAVLEFKPGIWQQAITNHVQATREFHNHFQPRHPVESLVQFILNETVAQWADSKGQPIKRNQLDSIQQLTNNTLKSVDHWMQHLERHGENDFVVPREVPESEQQLLGTLLSIIPVISDPWFPRGSWPWTLSRQAAFTMAGKGQHTVPELQRLLDHETLGPLGYWAMAAFLKQFGSPRYRPFAQHALQTLAGPTFEHEAALLVARDRWTGQVISTLGTNLRLMSPDTVKQLATPLPAAWQELLMVWGRELKTHPDHPATDLFLESLQQVWEKELASQVASELQKLIQVQPRNARATEAKPR